MLISRERFLLLLIRFECHITQFLKFRHVLRCHASKYFLHDDFIDLLAENKSFSFSEPETVEQRD